MSGSGPMDAFVVDHVTAAALKDAKAHIKELLEEKKLPKELGPE